MKVKLNPLNINPLKLNPIRIRRKKSDYAKKIGLPPGQIMYVGEHDMAPVKISLIKYNETEVIEEHIESVDEIASYLDPAYTIWINLDGINDSEIMQKLSELFAFHPLMTEDIMNTEHFPKSEEFEQHHFFTLKMMRLIQENGDTSIVSEHLSLVLGSHFLISFQDKLDGDVFDNVRARLQSSKARLRTNRADYLFYALIDSVVDRYFNVMEFIRERIEDMEDYVLENPTEHYINHIISIKKQLTNLRKVVIPLKDAIERLFSDESDYIGEDTYTYFRDVQDHIIHLSSTLDGFKDSVSSLMDMYMSNLSTNLNIIMKTLTIFSLFFVPLTFIAGLYGMNFQYMPELHWRYGYPVVLIIMTGSVITMFIYLRRKRWL